MRMRISLVILALLPLAALAQEAPALFPNRPHPIRNAVQHSKERRQVRKEKRVEKRAAKRQTAEPPKAPPRIMPLTPLGAVLWSIRRGPCDGCQDCQPE